MAATMGVAECDRFQHEVSAISLNMPPWSPKWYSEANPTFVLESGMVGYLHEKGAVAVQVSVDDNTDTEYIYQLVLC